MRDRKPAPGKEKISAGNHLTYAYKRLTRMRKDSERGDESPFARTLKSARLADED